MLRALFYLLILAVLVAIGLFVYSYVQAPPEPGPVTREITIETE